MHNFYNLNPDQNKKASDSINTVTLDVNVPLDNPNFHELFNTYCNNPDIEMQNKLGAYLNTINYLICILPDSVEDSHSTPHTLTIKKDDNLSFLISSTKEREVYLPIFTDSSQIPLWYTDPVYTLSVPAVWLWKFVLSQKNYQGVVINPGSIEWSITLEHIQSLLDDLN